MKAGSPYLVVVLLALLCGCGNGAYYEQKSKTIDSLSGALNLRVSELSKTDTALLQRCINRFTYYSQFIKQNVNDTLSKNEADNLQVFYSSGRKLESFRNNRFAILNRAALLNRQLGMLALDIKNKNVNSKDLHAYLVREQEAATQLIEAAGQQQSLYYSGIEEFKLSLREVEVLIRKRNKGQLPVIVRDTLAL